MLAAAIKIPGKERERSVTTSGRERRQRGRDQPTRGLDTRSRPITSGELASIRTDLGKCAIGIDTTTRIVFKEWPLG